jgi:tetratricopeptide (TPR) repeat protein
MLARLMGPVVLALALSPALASAQGKAAKGEVRRDPQGVKGISPFWEALKKGDDLFVARDFDGAITAYRDAISKAPQNAMGHYRMGEAQLAKGEIQEAEASWVSALRFVGKDLNLKAKILFVLADLRERQRSYDDSKDRWTAYEQFAKQNAGAKTYPASATDRKKRIDIWKQMLVDYDAVKKRIAKRLAEADEKARKSAK